MKQSYEKPTAERLDFDYTDVVTASSVAQGCKNGVLFTHNGEFCYTNRLSFVSNSQG